MPTRIRSTTPNVSGGGGGPVVGGTVEWGPDFGEGAGSDGTTITITRPVFDLDSLALVGNVPVSAVVDLNALAIAGDVDVTVATDLDSLALNGDIDVSAAADLDSLALAGSAGTVTATTDLDALALLGDIDVTTTVDGTALGAPFWQSVALGETSGAVSTIDVAQPSGTVDGNLLLVILGQSDQNAPVPSGWAAASSEALVGSLRLQSFWKFASSEPSSYSFSLGGTMGLTANALVEVHRIIGVDPTTPINAAASATVSALDLDPDPSAPAVTTTATNCLVFASLLHSHLALTQTHSPPTSHIERTDNEAGTTVLHSLTTAERVFATTGVKAAVEFNCTETVATDGCMLRIAVAPGPVDLVP